MHDPYPKYLGVTLDRTLSLREHLVIAEKQKQLTDEASWLAGAPMLKPCDHLHWLYATQLQSTVPLFGPAQLTQVWSMYS